MRIDAVDVGIVARTDALVDFYEQALGLERLEARVFPFATVHRLACGPVILKVMVPLHEPDRAEAVTPFWARDGIRYLTLWVAGLDELSAAWAGAGGVVTMPPTELRPGLRSALLADPDGNVVEAMEDSTAG